MKLTARHDQRTAASKAYNRIESAQVSATIIARELAATMKADDADIDALLALRTQAAYMLENIDKAIAIADRNR